MDIFETLLNADKGNPLQKFAHLKGPELTEKDLEKLSGLLADIAKTTVSKAVIGGNIARKGARKYVQNKKMGLTRATKKFNIDASRTLRDWDNKVNKMRVDGRNVKKTKPKTKVESIVKTPEPEVVNKTSKGLLAAAAVTGVVGGGVLMNVSNKNRQPQPIRQY